ncbi:MAG: hypothetical protein ACK56W_19695 [Pirellula sp.]|nr:hypothetical protein [Pirellula sp.]
MDGWSHVLTKEDGGCWYIDIEVAALGDEYRYRIVHGDKEIIHLEGRVGDRSAESR